MSGHVRRVARPHGARAQLTLLLAVVAGVVAMHGLGPAVAVPTAAVPTAGAAEPVAAHLSAHTVPASASQRSEAGREAHRLGEHALGGPERPTRHSGRGPMEHRGPVDHDGGGGRGHADHADDVCAAGGVSTAPALPGLVPAIAVSDADLETRYLAPTGVRGERAPPSLSALQLLRI